MEVLSPKSANLPMKAREAMKNSTKTTQAKPAEKPTNPDKIDDKWRPPAQVTEPGNAPETYSTGKKLGKGGFAVCFEGRTQSSGQVFALKVVKAQIQQKKMLEKFRTEMQIHAKLQHPNIVEFLRAFTIQDYTYVVLELCSNGSLADMVKTRTCLSLPEVRRYMIQICGGVKYIHKRNVIHRDLKMGNVFIDAKMNLKIGDFGLAAVMADEQDRRTTLCGTPNYIAPEILNKTGARGHDCKVDTWAIGVICYAMLTGRPPFQSATQQEIYNKLRTLEYEWKIDSVNYIPQEAKECVASCLNLVAAERPDMDELVEHEFFRMGAIAEQLDTSCLKTQPTWLQNTDPRGDRVRPGYGLDHGLICAECGVGKLLDGRVRQAVGENAKLSALMEIEVENRQGTAPITPLPEGILYKQFREVQAEWSSTQKHPLSARPRSRKPIEAASSISTTINKTPEELNLDGALTGRTLPPPALSSARPIQSFAAQQRQQALPRNVVGRSTMVSSEAPQQRLSDSAEEKALDGQGLLRAKPVRARSVREKTSRPAAESQMAKPITTDDKLDALAERLIQETVEAESRSRPTKTSTLPTRSRSLRSKVTSIPSSVSQPSLHTVEPAKDIHPSMTSTTRSSRVLSKKTIPSFEEIEKIAPTTANEFELPKFKTSFKPRLIEVSESYTLVPASSHAKVMKSLRDFYTGLEQTSATNATKQKTASRSTTPQHPRVDKWVDYATKHGIAYIMTDGSLGMILKSKEEESSASSCIVVRNARHHTILRARGVEHQLVPQNGSDATVEFYEQTDAAFATKRYDVPSSAFELDMKKHASQSAASAALHNSVNASAAQRVKEVCLLDKFGKYMNKQMGASDMTEPEQYTGRQKSHFIHFFQRMGNVGVWRFAGGGLQFNFPDHTKIVIYRFDDLSVASESGEIMLDLVYLEPQDAKILAAGQLLSNDALERRGIRTFSLNDIRTNHLRRSEAEIIRSNEVREKLDWIRAVIGLWIKEGGLGWTGDEKLGWSGMREERPDKKTRLQWVTVGRPGGDEEIVSGTASGGK